MDDSSAGFGAGSYDVSDEEFEGALHDNAENAAGMSGERAQRFYDRIRGSIRTYVEGRGGVLGKTAEYLLLVPDVFNLLWRLTNDVRVNGKNKVLLVSAIAYFVSPFDLVPEAFVGPIGYLDDLIFGVYVLNRMLGDTDESILRQHWSGDADVLESIEKVLNAADQLVTSDVLAKFKRLTGDGKKK